MSEHVCTQTDLLDQFPDNNAFEITPENCRNHILSGFGWSDTIDPTADNDNADTAGIGQFFDLGSSWTNTSTGRLFRCLDGTPTAAQWVTLMYDGEAAGGDLTGTYPNPTLASPGGSVTSVGVSMSPGWTVSNSPITSAGVIAITQNAVAANTVLAGAASGSPASPSARTLVSADLPAGIVGSTQIAAGAVGTTQIAAGAVGSSQLASNAVGSSNIAAGAVGSSQLASNAVGSSNIAAGAVGSSQLGSGAVGTSNIAAGAVDSAALGTGAVGSGNIAAGAVGSSALGSGAVTSAKIGSGAVGSSNIASGAVGDTQVSGLSGSKINAAGFDATYITVGTIASARLPAGLAIAGNIGVFPQWIFTNVNYTNVNSSGLSNTLTLVTLPAGGVLHAIKYLLTQTWTMTGGSPTAGIGFSSGGSTPSSNTTKYGTLGLTTAPPTLATYTTSSMPDLQNESGSWNATFTVSTISGNLNTLSSGNMKIWCLVSAAA